MKRLSILFVLKCFYQMGATPAQLVRDAVRLLVDRKFRAEWTDPEWVIVR